MLRINAIANSGAAKAYFKGSDYYIDGHEQTATWHGKGAAMLGLSGQIDFEDFGKLCDNLNPATGKQLTAKMLLNRRVGYDLTFSLPKSLSLAYALGGDERIAHEFRAAVADTMAELEREMATRVRKGGKDVDRTTGNMIWADFMHHTSRPIGGYPDPQLHIHAVAFNATYDREENQWKAGQFGHLKADAPYFQALFRARLAERVQSLGYAIRRTKDDFEIVGVPERTVSEFSRRTNQIEALADQLGVTRPETKAKLGTTSREAKREGQSWAMLLRAWERRLKPGELEAINGTVSDSMRSAPEPMADRSREAVDWALRHLLERKSVVSQRQVVTEALKHGLGEVTPEGIYKELGSRKDLIRREVGGREMVSTQGVLGEEKRIVEFAVKGRGRFRPLQSHQKKKDERVQPDPATLSPSQQAAIRHVWTSPDRLILIRGAAGTGKTTLTKAALAGIDVPYQILAPSAEASRGVLRRDGFENADTLARFLIDDKMQESVRGGLIWLDEASLAGASQLADLVKVAERVDARIVLSGDRRQHKSVARGDVLALLEDRAGLPVAEVSEIKRQSGEYRRAVESLAKGDVADGFRRLDDLGWVVEPDQFVGVNKMIAADYLAAVRSNRSVLVVSPTHVEGESVTAAIREKLKQDGRLKGEERTFERLQATHLTAAERSDPETLRAVPNAVAVFARNAAGQKAGSRVDITPDAVGRLAGQADRTVVYQKGSLSLATGDAIRITANGKTLDGKHRLNNGATYTVSGFTPDGDIRLNNGWVVGKDFGHLAYGYVATSHASQGRTVDVALIAMGNQSLPAMGAEQFYVSASRARHQTRIYVEDKQSVLDAIQRDDTRLLASDLVRVQRKGLRERMKRHLGFLRRVAILGRNDVNRKPERDYVHER